MSVVYAGRTGEIIAINGIDLFVDRGEFVCLLGPSGCGKTTLLNAVAGFLPISSGELTFSGKPIARPGPDRAMVLQQPGLLPWRDVLHNVTYGLEMSGGLHGREAAAHATGLLELVGLADFARSFPNQLSGGMQQRVNLARALALCRRADARSLAGRTPPRTPAPDICLGHRSARRRARGIGQTDRRAHRVARTIIR